MRNAVRLLLVCVVLSLFYAGAVSCSGTGNYSGENKAGDTVGGIAVTPRQKGKLHETVNVNHRRLTLAESNMYGKVKSVTRRHFTIAENGSRVLTLKSYDVYDTAGHIVEGNDYKPDGKQSGKCTFVYDGKGLLTSWELWYNDMSTTSRSRFIYDSMGYKTEQDNYGKGPEIVSKTIFKSDNIGSEIERDEYADDKHLARVTSYKYDASGNEIEYSVKAPGRGSNAMLSFKYDDQGNVVEGVSFDSSGNVIKKWTTELGNKGLDSKTVYYKPDGQIESKIVARNDEHKNVIEYAAYAANDSLQANSVYYEYGYDAQGNITKETDYKMISGRRVAVAYVESEYQYY